MYEPAPVGITLFDQPYTLPPPISPIVESPPIDTTPTRINAPKKEPGIFRQISLRLSNRKRRQHDDNTATSLHISEPIGTVRHSESMITPLASSSEPLLHPAAVVTSTVNNKKTRE